jgi:hypothetical protein
VLDVLITVSESTPRHFVSECRRSVRVAAEFAQYPVNVIEVPGVPGHIGQAMLGGLAKSTAPYIAWIDDDDFVLPNAFTCLERHFTATPSAICAREIQLLANGSLRPVNRRHHLTAFRRDVVDTVDLANFPGHGNVALHNAARSGAVDELSWVYVWRRRRSPGMAVRANITAAQREALQ